MPAIAANLADARGVGKGSQKSWVKRVENAAHRVIARHGPVEAIDAAQIALFRDGLLFEIKQRRRLERKHGEGAFQDIGQSVANMRGTGVRESLKPVIEKAPQFVKCEILLPLAVTFCHLAMVTLIGSISKLRITGKRRDQRHNRRLMPAFSGAANGTARNHMKCASRPPLQRLVMPRLEDEMLLFWKEIIHRH